MNSGKTADSIEMPYGVVGRVDPMNGVLHAGARWRQLASTVERLCAAATSASAMHQGGDAACSQINLSSLVHISL